MRQAEVEKMSIFEFDQKEYGQLVRKERRISVKKLCREFLEKFNSIAYLI